MMRRSKCLTREVGARVHYTEKNALRLHKFPLRDNDVKQ